MELNSRFNIETAGFKQDLDSAKRHVENTMKDIEKSGMDAGDVLSKVGKMAGTAFAAFSAQQFVSQIISVRQEFQKLETSFTTLLGSAEKGRKMFLDVTNYATHTPLLEKDIASAAQTLLGFNTEAEKVMPILKQIGDISMGDSQKFQSLTLAFAQASSTGKLMGQDLLQMINAGFNPLAEISRTTGISIADLKQKMSDGQITVEMLEGAFKSATAEGGKFHGMLEQMSHTMEGSFSNLQGAIQKSMNDAGKMIEKPIVEGANAATDAINYTTEHMEELATIIKYMVAMYGTYKTACLVVAAAQQIQAQAAAGYGLKTVLLRKELKLTQAAQAMLNKTMLANPYVIAALAIGTLCFGLYKLATADSAAEAAQKSLNREFEAAREALEKKNEETERDIALANDESKASDQRTAALDRLIAKYPDIIQKYIDEEGHLQNILELKREIAQVEGKNTLTNLKKETDQYKQYADVVEKAAKNGRGSLTSQEKKILSRAEATFAGEAGAATRVTSDLNDIALFFRNKSAGTATEYGKQQGEQTVAVLKEGITTMTKAQLNQQKRLLQGWQTQLNNSGRNYINVRGKGNLSRTQISQLLGQVDSRLGEETAGEERTRLQKARNQAKRNLDKARKNNNTPASELKKLQETYDAAEKAWDSSPYGKLEKENKKGSKSASDAAKKAVEAATRSQELTDLQKELAQATSRAEQDAIFEAEAAAIKAMGEGTQANIREIQLNYEKEKVAIERGIEDTKQAKEKAERALWEKSQPKDSKDTWESKGRAEVLASNPAAFDLTANQLAMFNQRGVANENTRRQAIEAIENEGLKNLQSILSDAGALEASLKAIRARYAASIDTAKAQGDIIKAASLINQRDTEISAAQAKSRLASLDMTSVFGDLGMMFNGLLKEAVNGLRDYIKSPEFAKLKPTDQKSIMEGLNQLRSRTYGVSDTRQQMSESIIEANNAMHAYTDTVKRNATALNTALENYKQAIIQRDAVDPNSEEFKRLDELAKGYAQSILELTEENRQAATRAKTSNIKMTNSTKSVTSSQSSLTAFMRTAGLTTFAELFSAVDSLRGGVKGLQALNRATKKAKEGEKTATDDMAASAQNASAATDDMAANMNQQAADVAKTAAEGANAAKELAKDAAEGAADAAKESIKQIGDALGKAGFIAQIIAAIIKILDILKDGVGPIVEGILDSIGNAINGILSNIGSGQMFAQIGSGVFNLAGGAIEGVANLFSGGAAGDFLGLGGNKEDDQAAQRDISNMNSLISDIKGIVGDILSEMRETGVTAEKAERLRERALRDLQVSQAATIQAFRDQNSQGASKSSHSNGVYFDRDSYTARGLKETLQKAGFDTSRFNNQATSIIASLTPDEAKAIANDVEMMKHIYSVDSDNSTNAATTIKALADLVDEAQDVEDAFMEALTGISFDDLKNAWNDMLMDLESSTGDAIEKINQNFMETYLNEQLGQEGGIYDRLKEWQKRYQNMVRQAAEAGRKLTSTEFDALRNEYISLQAEARDIRDQAAEITGYDDTSNKEAQGTINGVKSITDDTANEIVGGITAIRLNEEQEKAQLATAIGQLGTINTGISENNTILRDIRELQETNNEYTADVAEYTRKMYTEWNDNIETMTNHIKNL